MNCREFEELLGPALEGEILPPQMAQWDAHGASCGQCRLLLASTRTTRTRLRETFERLGASQPKAPAFRFPPVSSSPFLSFLNWLFSSPRPALCFVLILVCALLWFGRAAPPTGHRRTVELDRHAAWKVSEGTAQTIPTAPVAAAFSELTWFRSGASAALHLESPTAGGLGYALAHLFLRTPASFGVSSTAFELHSGVAHLHIAERQDELPIVTPHVRLITFGGTIALAVHPEGTLLEMVDGTMILASGTDRLRIEPGRRWLPGVSGRRFLLHEKSLEDLWYAGFREIRDPAAKPLEPERGIPDPGSPGIEASTDQGNLLVPDQDRPEPAAAGQTVEPAAAEEIHNPEEVFFHDEG
jgi:hypothetical protein